MRFGKRKSGICLSLLVSAPFLIGCESTPVEFDTPSQEELISGTWELVAYSTSSEVILNTAATVIPPRSRGNGVITLGGDLEFFGGGLEREFSIVEYWDLGFGPPAVMIASNYDDDRYVGFVVAEGRVTSVNLLDSEDFRNSLQLPADSSTGSWDMETLTLTFDQASLLSDDSTTSVTVDGSLQVPSYQVHANTQARIPGLESAVSLHRYTISINENHTFTWLKQYKNGDHLLETGLWSMDANYIHFDYEYWNGETFPDSTYRESLSYTFEGDNLRLQLDIGCSDGADNTWLQNDEEFCLEFGELTMGLDQGTLTSFTRSIEIELQPLRFAQQQAVSGNESPNIGSIFDFETERPDARRGTPSLRSSEGRGGQGSHRR